MSLRRFSAAVAALAVALIASPAPALQEESPETILAHVMERNPSLQTFEARVHVDLHLTTFPFLAQKLEGKTYFKRPSNYEVVFEKVPSYAKNFQKVSSDVGDVSDWAKRFNITITGERSYNNHRDIEMRMVQRVRGMIDHEVVLVDPSAWAIDSIEYHYYNGGSVVMTQTFRDMGGYSLLTEQHVRIAIPFAHAVGAAVYNDYHTNVAVDDSLFHKKN